MLIWFLISFCFILSVKSSEDGSGVGLPYLSSIHNSQQTNKFQRAFESIGTALSNQGSKDVGIQEQSYDGIDYEIKKSYSSVGEQNYSDQSSDHNNSQRLRDQFWSQLFVNHDNNKKNSIPTVSLDSPQQQQQLTYELQSNTFDTNRGEEENIGSHHIIQNQGTIKAEPIDISAQTTPATVFVMNAPAFEHRDRQWTSNGQQLTNIGSDERQELNRDNNKEQANYFPQQPILTKPKIQTIEAKCAKEAIHVRVTYDRPFDGIIYAKDYYNDISCHYVEPRSGQMMFEFSMDMNRCGTTLMDEYSTKGETILENTVVFQNEPVFQEIWDSVRHLRCAWSGVFDKTVQTSVNVGAHDSQTITYRGDSVDSVMDVQYGHGLKAAPVQGYVRIGDDLTLSVSLIGSDANNFDVRVKDCIAHDGDVRNAVQLTDDSGCVLKKKLLGNWQKQRNAMQSSITTFTYMQAFRFPDKMQVYFECNIEICKYECKHYCQDIEEVLFRSQSHKSEDMIKLRAKRTTNWTENKTNESGVEPIRLLRGIRVVVPNDFDFIESQNLSSIPKNDLLLQNNDSICVTISFEAMNECLTHKHVLK